MQELLYPTLSFIFEIAGLGLVGTLLYVFLSIVATLKSVRYTTGAAVPVWLAFIWLVPFIGAICAILFIRKTPVVY